MHYIMTPPRMAGLFKVFNLNNDSETHEFPVKSSDIHEDKCFFHWDDSGRVIFQTSDCIEFHKMVISGGSNRLLKQFEISAKTDTKEHPVVSTRGRVCKKRSSDLNQVILYNILVLVSSMSWNDRQIF